jgi:hypothetical protein
MNRAYNLTLLHIIVVEVAWLSEMIDVAGFNLFIPMSL